MNRAKKIMLVILSIALLGSACWWPGPGRGGRRGHGHWESTVIINCERR